MQVLQLIVIVLVGLSLGVMGGLARVPEVKWIPHLSFLVLTVASYAALLAVWEISPVEAVLFIITVFGGTSLYAGRLWQQLDLEPGVSYWGFAKRDLLNPLYLRRLYRRSLVKRRLH